MDNRWNENSAPTLRNSITPSEPSFVEQRPPKLLNNRACAGFEISPELLAALCGANDQHLRYMSSLFGARVQCRGNQLYLNSPSDDLQRLFQLFLHKLLSYMEQGIDVQVDLLDALYNASKNEFQHDSTGKAPGSNFYDPRDTTLSLNGKKILPRNRRQHELIKQLRSCDVIFALGPAGTGKTFLAVAYGLSRLLNGQASLLLLSRPVVEAGENLGFLPGDFGQKIGPYMMPLFDTMRYLMKPEQVTALEAKGMIEVAPLAYMRGRSLRDAIIILDEAQNATPLQVKMLLTRLGEGSQAILTGDTSQSDLGHAHRSGLHQASHILAKVEGIAVQQFRNEDVVRSALVRRIIQAYDSATQNDEQIAKI